MDFLSRGASPGLVLTLALLCLQLWVDPHLSQGIALVRNHIADCQVAVHDPELVHGGCVKAVVPCLHQLVLHLFEAGFVQPGYLQPPYASREGWVEQQLLLFCRHWGRNSVLSVIPALFRGT